MSEQERIERTADRLAAVLGHRTYEPRDVLGALRVALESDSPNAEFSAEVIAAAIGRHHRLIRQPGSFTVPCI